MAEEKPHKPSTRKLKKAREEGKVVKSQFIGKVTLLCFIITVVFSMLPILWTDLRFLLEYCLIYGQDPGSSCAAYSFKVVYKTLACCLGGGCLVVLMTEFMQVGFSISWKAVKPDINRINPIKGFSRIAKNIKQSWSRILAILLIFSSACWVIKSYLEKFVKIILFEVEKPVWVILEYNYVLLIPVAIILLLFVIIDYLGQRKEYFKEQSMSTEELRRETKDTEGDPAIKSAQAAMQKELAYSELVSRIRNSKVIVVERA